MIDHPGTLPDQPQSGREDAPLPTIALSIRQPWAWLIVNGWKDIENRDWRTHFRGPVLIHAGMKLEKDEANELLEGFCPVGGMMPMQFVAPREYERGGIVGVAEIVDCVAAHGSRWFVGKYGFVLRNARSLPFRQCKGALGFFTPDYSLVEPKVRAPKVAAVFHESDPEPDLFGSAERGAAQTDRLTREEH